MRTADTPRGGRSDLGRIDLHQYADAGPSGDRLGAQNYTPNHAAGIANILLTTRRSAWPARKFLPPARRLARPSAGPCHRPDKENRFLSVDYSAPADGTAVA
jgi:hypothetical protein